MWRNSSIFYPCNKLKSRYSLLNSGTACCLSAQNLVSSRLLSRNAKIKIYRTINIPILLYGRETWSLTELEPSSEGCLRTTLEITERVERRVDKFFDEEPHNLYLSLHSLGVMNSKFMGWAEHVAYIGQIRNAYKINFSQKT
jgi:hypothetical protein